MKKMPKQPPVSGENATKPTTLQGHTEGLFQLVLGMCFPSGQLCQIIPSTFLCFIGRAEFDVMQKMLMLMSGPRHLALSLSLSLSLSL